MVYIYKKLTNNESVALNRFAIKHKISPNFVFSIPSKDFTSVHASLTRMMHMGELYFHTKNGTKFKINDIKYNNGKFKFEYQSLQRIVSWSLAIDQNLPNILFVLPNIEIEFEQWDIVYP